LEQVASQVHTVEKLEKNQVRNMVDQELQGLQGPQDLQEALVLHNNNKNL